MTSVCHRRSVLAGGAALWLAACARDPAQAEPPAQPRRASDRAAALIAAARAQIGVTTAYDPAYTTLAYPGGDVARGRGVCTDVVIRAYRDALGVDLQQQVHEDMAGHFAAYPRRWGLRRPDRNIDHRRVPNLETFWQRAGAKQPVPGDVAAWQPGDIFTSLVGGSLPHTGVVSDIAGPGGVAMVIHNIGAGTREEPILAAQRLTGRYRWQV